MHILDVVQVKTVEVCRCDAHPRCDRRALLVWQGSKCFASAEKISHCTRDNFCGRHSCMITYQAPFVLTRIDNARKLLYCTLDSQTYCKDDASVHGEEDMQV